MKTATRLALLGVAAGVWSGACTSWWLNYHVRVVIPAEIQSIDQGVLRLSLWSYDPLLADAPADLVDEHEVSFSHAGGASQSLTMLVRGDIGDGRRPYITVRGYELTSSGEAYVLWDGIEGVGMPREVVMRSVGQ